MGRTPILPYASTAGDTSEDLSHGIHGSVVLGALLLGLLDLAVGFSGES